MLDHNLLLLNEHTNKHHTKQTLKSYDKCLNKSNPQSTDIRYIKPPLQITNLTLYTQEYNPEKGIQTNQPTHNPNPNVEA